MYDVVIIGGGPAGLASGVYTSRGGMRTLILEKMAIGGQAVLTEKIENYPGFSDGIGGLELLSRFEQQAKKFGCEIKFEEVKKIERANNKILVSAGEVYESLAVILAVGSSPRKLNIPGEKEFTGRGVSYCATCDGPFFRDKTVAVVGGGDSAVEEAIYLTKFAAKVYLIHRRDRLRAAKILQERAFSNKKIEFVWNSVPVEISGENFVEKIFLKNLKTDQNSSLVVNGVFVFAGNIPNTAFLDGFVELDKNGFIIVNGEMKTSQDGFFAAGDCVSKKLYQVVTAAGDGATAAFSAQKFVEELKGIAYD